MTLVDYWDVIRRRLGLIAFVVFLGGFAVLLVGRPSAPGATTYSGSSLLTVDSSVETTEVLYLDFVAQQTSAVVDKVKAQIPPGTYGEADVARVLAGTVSTKPNADIGVLQINVSNQPSGEAASELLRLYGQAIIDFAAEAKVRERDDALRAVEARVAGLESQISVVQGQLKAKGAATGAGGTDVDPRLQAQLNTLVTAQASAVTEAENLRTQSTEQLSPVSFIGGPRVTVDSEASDPLGLQGRLALGLLVGLLLGVGMAFAIHRFDRRVYNRRDAETGFQLPVLAEIPAIPFSKRRRFQLITQQEPTAPASEAYRILRSSVDHARARQLHGEGDRPGGGTVVLVTAASERVGTSTTAANLAVASVYAGKKVLIVAADLRHPTIHHYFRVENGPGLADFVDDRWRSKPIDFAAYVQSTGVPDVALIHHGRQVVSAGETVAAIGPLIEVARSQFDIVFIDSPSMQAGSDVNELVGFADLVVLVCRIGRSTTDDGELAYELTERLQAPTCGLALVGIRGSFRHSAAGRLLRSALRRVLPRPNRPGNRPSAGEPVERGAIPTSGPLPRSGPLPARGPLPSSGPQPANGSGDSVTRPAENRPPTVFPPPWPAIESDPYGASQVGLADVTLTMPAVESPQRPRGREEAVAEPSSDESTVPPADGPPPANGVEVAPAPSGNGAAPERHSEARHNDTPRVSALDGMTVAALDLVDEDEPGPGT